MPLLPPGVNPSVAAFAAAGAQIRAVRPIGGLFFSAKVRMRICDIVRVQGWA